MQDYKDVVPFPNLLTDLLELSYEYEQKAFGRKVLRVYGLCLRQKHFELAARICKKYNSYFMKSPQSDMAVAFGMALMAQNKKKI